MRRTVAYSLAALLTFPPLAAAAQLDGTVHGMISVAGRPAAGLSVSLVNLSSGRIHTVRSGQDGQFAARVAPGEYIITSRGEGMAVGSGPAMVNVAAGAVATARLNLAAASADLVRAHGQVQPGPGGEGGMGLGHDFISCFVEGEGNSPILDSVITPPEQIFNVECFFDSGLNPGTFYSVTGECDPQGACRCVLPWPTAEADPMTYYILVNGGPPEGAETRQQEVTIIEEGEECDGRIAPIALVGPGALALLGGGGLSTLVVVGAAAGVAVTAGTTIALTNDGGGPQTTTTTTTMAPASTTTTTTTPPPPSTTAPPAPTTTTTTTTTTPPPPTVPPVSPIRGGGE